MDLPHIRRSFLLPLLSFLLTLTVSGAEPPPRGLWKCTALDPQTLVLTGDYTDLQRELFQRRYAERLQIARKLPAWAMKNNFNSAGTEAIAQYRPAVMAMLRDRPNIAIAAEGAPVKIRRTGVWLSPTGQSRFPDTDGKEKVSPNADVAFYSFLELDRPLANGEKITITMPAGETVPFVYRDDVPSPMFKINQIGYMPDAGKYAYLGAWLGTAGAMPLHARLDGKPFRLADAATGKTAFTGVLHRRPADPVNPNGAPFTGEEVLELDFSKFDRPGKYYLAVDGIGRSAEFRIGDDTMAEAFYIHARGLYHQRCGIAKEKPYTNWTAPICHRVCYRGTFPPDIAHYTKGPAKQPWGFRTTDGKSLNVNHFLLIEQNPHALPLPIEAPGGWHDAADWDRRPQHLGIVGDLAAVYLLKPENFCDGQLNLPESGNGIPDILDEAVWGLKHLRKLQSPDGGVGTWIETTRHPTPADGGSWEDRLPYYQSCATRNSTLEYAAYAAELALALKRAGAEQESAAYRDSALRAWKFAVNPAKRVKRHYQYNGRPVFYRDEEKTAAEFLVKAGFDLYLLTEQKKFLDAAEQAAGEAAQRMRKIAWRWSPFIWVELEVYPCYSPKLNKLRNEWRRSLVGQAQKMIQQQEKAYPIRVPWFAVDEGWVHTMGWGTSHPLRRARVLVAAHAFSGDRNFLEGALLANDFHNGANPFGTTMTSGLGRVYPVRFLHLDSYADGIAEFVPGITPYRNTYGIPRNAVRMAYGLFYPQGRDFGGLSLSLLPQTGLDEGSCVKELNKVLPIWRRWGNVEGQTVGASEFTVWETISPAAAVTGYLLNKAQKPAPEWLDRKPAADIRSLPGYAPLP